MTRLLSADVLTQQLERDGTSEALDTASSELTPTVGLWEAGPGEDVDVEVDEVFVVLSGRGVVTFEDGESIELRPGVAVRLRAGDRTTWTLVERLRKLYVV